MSSPRQADRNSIRGLSLETGVLHHRGGGAANMGLVQVGQAVKGQGKVVEGCALPDFVQMKTMMRETPRGLHGTRVGIYDLKARVGDEGSDTAHRSVVADTLGLECPRCCEYRRDSCHHRELDLYPFLRLYTCPVVDESYAALGYHQLFAVD